MHKMMIELSEAQHKAANAHAKKKGRELAEDIVAVWWGRMMALDRYAEKLTLPKEKFRVYLPRKAKEDVRDKIRDEFLAMGNFVKPPPPPVKKERKAKKKIEPKAKKVKAPKVKKAKKEPKAKGHKIDLYDTAEVALAKARIASEHGGRDAKSILKDNGREPDGKLVPVKALVSAPKKALVSAPKKAAPKKAAPKVKAAPPPAAPPPAAPPPAKGVLSEEMKAKLKAAGIGHPEVK